MRVSIENRQLPRWRTPSSFRYSIGSSADQVM
jgi:hypothetical protein